MLTEGCGAGVSQVPGVRPTISVVAVSVERICAAASDARALRLGIIDVLRATVGFDAYAWLLTDPQTSVGCAPLADVPCLDRLPQLIRLKYLTDLNRWTGLGDAPVALRDPSRSLVWRDLLRGYGVRDVASMVFRDSYGCWGFLDLWRTAATFSSADLDLLARMLRPVTAALRRCQAATLAQSPEHAPRPAPVVLLLSPGLDVRRQTPETARYLRELVPPDDGREPVPAGAYNVAAQLLANEAGVDRNPPAARVHLSQGRWLTLRAARLGGEDIAVTVEETSPAERLGLFGAAHGLSPREAELLDHLAGGCDTREIARRMFLSEHTVQDHLKSIFAKTGAANRRVLLSRAAGS